MQQLPFLFRNMSKKSLEILEDKSKSILTQVCENCAIIIIMDEVWGCAALDQKIMKKEASLMAQFRSKPFGVTKNGDKVDEYIISNPGGLEISVLNYGCVIKNLFVPTKTGLVDVVVGHDTLADYEADFNSSGSTCCGAFVGRYANRIENAEFSLSGKTYKLEANNGKNHLHGTFPRKIYDVKMFGDTLLMETESPAGEDGFPGNLKVSVRYILTPDNTLRMDYRVSS